MSSSGISDFYLVYDNKCLFCSKFISFIDKKFNSSHSKVYILSSIKQVKEFFDLNDLILLEDLQKKTIILILPNKKFLIKGEAILMIFKISNNRLLVKISNILKIIPIKIINILYDVFSRYRSIFNNKDFSCNIYKPNNLILLK